MEEHNIDYVLGKNTSKYETTYNPNILAREARKHNRDLYNIKEEDNLFVGVDSWHIYEISFLTNNGRPIVGLMKLVISSNSKYIVESKSLKLYLFSFNMERLGDTKEEAIQEFYRRVSGDLNILLETSIELKFFDHLEAKRTIRSSDLFLYENIDTHIDLDQIVFDTFTETPDLLKTGSANNFTISSDLLRSACRITNQPDWGTIYIKYRGEEGISLDSLARYIVSFRGENHFHEEIVECMYKRILDRFKPKDLMITALYTRRGGIDICPIRATSLDIFPSILPDVKINDLKEYRQ